MHILLIGNHINTQDKIMNFTSVYSYYISMVLNLIEGMKVSFDSPKSLKNMPAKDIIEYYENLDVTPYDHIIALGLRYFDTIPKECGKILMKKVKGCLGQLYDGSLLDSQPVHINFTTRDDSWKYPIDAPNNRYIRHTKYNKYIGWAADENLCSPKQSNDELRILVDHSGFDCSSMDLTLHILLNIKNFVDSKIWQQKFKSIKIRQIVDNAIIDCDLDNICVTPHSRKGVSYVEACMEYSKSHIFMPTHKESVGLTVLETAMSGALVVSPKNYIPKDRLQTIRYVEYENQIDWTKVLDAIDIDASRKIALSNNWTALANNLIEHLRNFCKTDFI